MDNNSTQKIYYKEGTSALKSDMNTIVKYRPKAQNTGLLKAFNRERYTRQALERQCSALRRENRQLRLEQNLSNNNKKAEIFTFLTSLIAAIMLILATFLLCGFWG